MGVDTVPIMVIFVGRLARVKVELLCPLWFGCCGLGVGHGARRLSFGTCLTVCCGRTSDELVIFRFRMV